MTCLGCFHTDPPIRVKRLPKLFTRVDLPEATYTHTEEDGAPLTYEANELAAHRKKSPWLTLVVTLQNHSGLQIIGLIYTIRHLTLH